MRNLTLCFDGAGAPELKKVEFSHERLHDECGRPQKVRHSDTADFQWREGTQSLALFFVKAVASLCDPDTAGPFYLEGPQAAPLADIVRHGAVGPNWPVTLFGYADNRRTEPMLMHLVAAALLRKKTPRLTLLTKGISAQDVVLKRDGQNLSGDRPGILRLVRELESYFPSEENHKDAIIPCPPEPGSGAEVATAAPLGLVSVELTIDCDFDSYTDEQQRRLLRAIGLLLEVGVIVVLRKRRGSVKLTIALTPEQAARLVSAFEAGLLNEHGVTRVDLGGRLVREEGPDVGGGVQALRESRPTSLDGEVTRLLQQLKQGDRSAVQDLWQRYYARLVRLAQQHLRRSLRRAADEEDVALSAFESFCRRAEQGCFPQLDDSDDLWQVLVTITVCKAADLANHERRQKRGEAVVAASELDDGDVFAELISREPDPALAAEVAENCQRLLDALGDGMLREIAVAKMEGETNKAIAARLGVSESTIERKLAGCREILKEALAAGYAPGDRKQQPVKAQESLGALVIQGGGATPDAVRDRFLELAGGQQARLVVIPTASADAHRTDQSSRFEFWQKTPAASVVLLHTLNRDQANDDAFVKPLTEATGVWLGGGDQARLIAAYRGTAVERELHKLLARGGVIGGTSAGASAMSALMIVGGNPEAEVGLGFGFALVEDVVIDQHFANRSRLKRLQDRMQRLQGILTRHTDHLGLGIDAETAVVIQGCTATVIGAANVWLCLPATVREMEPVQVYKDGDRIDLGAVRQAVQVATK
jgi:cyanophycinase